MLLISYIAHSIWSWIVDPGLSLAFLILCMFLIPRAGRLAMYIITNKVVDGQEAEQKSQLAFAGVAVYVAQIICYFLIFVAMLQQLGFSLAGAAIPATAASAAIGLGAQSIIADFLAGFFILSEKQYGVGDWVRFEGGATNIEGTVIQITMRATRIRTLAEETVIIPNSKAGVSINNSNHWSSAVVIMPLPLLQEANMEETLSRATDAAQRALHKEGVADVILGPLAVHPAVGINPPNTLGLPWTVNVRFLAQVKPGSQWLVERAIRVSIIDEFWPEYATFTISDVAKQGQVDADVATLVDADHRHVLTQAHAVSTSSPQTPVPVTAPAGTLSPEQAAKVTERGLLTAHDPAVPNRNAEDKTFDAGPTLGDARDGHDDDTTQNNSGSNSAERNSTDSNNHMEPRVKGWERFFSVGGRTRVSTTILIVIGIAILTLKVLTFSSEGEENPNGWLAPKSFTFPTPTTVAPTPVVPQSETLPNVSDTPSLTPMFKPDSTATNVPAPDPGAPESLQPAPAAPTAADGSASAVPNPAGEENSPPSISMNPHEQETR
ncbi:mechanosensitive ion channel family protein [Corynebacterium felinum]|uniref:Small conductance mechanosensitive channel n=1 Tax=Corynebacterium felinum TaxID=131318 RepID=A0ABU2B9R9_9CORY|nr:mechanosensitive ion channel family protein [Corynebacterium felinum]MDF5821804.1 mechanosensitive ion channel family protein [Corynebacterium felinum]MDR7355387.1 small conductance mechanosensitive channel [Corynebacterium felinum]WJY94739.1 putative MscS family protein YkuT [Corynebacterium felinum]